MKSILTISAIFAFGGLSYGHCGSCEKGHASKEGAKSECAPLACKKSECAKGECFPDAKTVKLAITGLKDQALRDKAMAVIAQFDGAKAKKSCNGLAIKYAASTVKETDIIQALTKAGLEVTEQEVRMKISGMTCGGCSDSLTKTLAKTDGVVGINKVCHASGHAVFTIDPGITDHQKITSVINATKFQVAKAKNVKAEETPQS